MSKYRYVKDLDDCTLIYGNGFYVTDDSRKLWKFHDLAIVMYNNHSFEYFLIDEYIERDEWKELFKIRKTKLWKTMYS